MTLERWDRVTKRWLLYPTLQFPRQRHSPITQEDRKTTGSSILYEVMI